jgi:hypothetical protein
VLLCEDVSKLEDRQIEAQNTNNNKREQSRLKMQDTLLFDSPITAVECAADGTIYFAAGNAVFRSGPTHVATPPIASPSRSSEVLPHLTTVRWVCAPPGTVITTLCVVSLPAEAMPILEAPETARRPPALVLIGAADRVLAQQDGVLEQPTGAECPAASASSSSPHDVKVAAIPPPPACCVCVLHAAESRVLRMAVDVARRLVLVLTASNDLFCLSLGDVVAVLCGGAPCVYRDVSHGVRGTRVRGPPLGVVLAADILIDDSRCGGECDNPDIAAGHDVNDSSVALTSSYRLFAATYSGEVVEWYPTEVGKTPQVYCRGARVEESCVAARVQAHLRGCAIFSVRVKQSAPLEGAGNCATSEGRWRKTHLVTCSDDRSVALFERCRCESKCAADGHAAPPDSENGWVLLWRGSGTSFSKSRIFDAAVCPVWSSTSSTPPHLLSSPLSSSGWTCAVHVAVAGEDGCVQAVRVDSADRPTPADPLLPCCACFVRARQHRGHGAYRVAFCTPSEGQMTIVSAGFDGVVLLHTYLSGAAMGTEAELRVQRMDAAAILAKEAWGSNGGLSHSSVARPPPSKAAQVRVVHVDAAGHVLAWTSHMLCVQYRGAAPALSWSAFLPNAVHDDGVASAAYGMPTCAESFHLFTAARPGDVGGVESVAVGMSCALIGSTTGALYAMPYACTRADGCVTYAAAHHSAETMEACAKTSTNSLVATTALQPYGKITHIAILDRTGCLDAGAPQGPPLLVATNHVRHTVVLTALHTRIEHAAHAEKMTGGDSVQLMGEWHFLQVWSDCPGPLTTTLAVLSPPVPEEMRAVSFWLLVGDKNGCLAGLHQTLVKATWSHPSTSDALPPTVSVKEAAAVCTYVFPEQLHIAISAVCVEASADGVRPCRCSVDEPLVLRVVGTGGAVEFFRLPTTAAGDEAMMHTACAVPSREPLRLPCEVSSILAVSSRIIVVQCGTTVSVLYRIPGRSSWVLVDTFKGIRAPRLLTAHICELRSRRGCNTHDGRHTAAAATPPVVYLAHCSDGHTVETFASFPDRAVLCQGSVVPCVRTSVLHGGGLPGKDYNCVAYAPAPLHALLLGNEDSSLAVYPLQSRCASPSLLRRFLTPLNICGAHHSNILAITVLPQCEEHDSGGDASGGLHFVSVGGGAMVNLWTADATSRPLLLVDWWCGGGAVPTPVVPTDESMSCAVGSNTPFDTTNCTVDKIHRPSSASFQRRRVEQALAGSPSSSSSTAALMERVARFMCVTAWDARAIAVGSSDGTVLFFHIQPTVTASRPSRSCAYLQLVWQGVLHPEQPKPILCVTSTACRTHDGRGEAALGLLVAGDTNGFVYVVDTVTHRVVAERRLEQSAVNALSEIHAMTTDTVIEASSAAQCVWRFAAVHDSGVVHLVQVDATFSSLTNALAPLSCDSVFGDTRVTVLSSASTGLTAGRSVRWPLTSRQALVAVTEERVTYFDPQQLKRGVLAVLRERRTNVRCVSGAVVVPNLGDDDGVLSGPNGATGGGAVRAANRPLTCGDALPHVATVGQGFELV